MSRLVKHHPYLGTLLLFLYFIGLWLLLHLFMSPIIKNIQLPYLQRGLIGELALALVVAVPISLLGWWSETGFTRGITRQGVVICLIPTALIALPLLCGLSSIVAGASVSLLLIAVALALLVGFVEEGFFRGVMLQSLLPGGIWLSVLLSSVLFASVHLLNLTSAFSWGYVAGQLLLAFGSGVLFAALRLRTGSIWPTVVLHAVRDVGGLILLGLHPQMVLSAPSSTAFIVNGVFCLLFLCNASYLLRPVQLRQLRVAYGLEPAPVTPPPDDLSLSHTPPPSRGIE